jgi:MSHA pilin protein MshC
MIKSPPLLQRCQPGFTLIELITVMLIIGIMAFIVLPRFDLLKGFDEIGYRDKVKATLEYARKSAVAMRRQVRVTIAASGLTVDFQQQTPEGEGAAAWSPLLLSGTNTNTFAAPNGVTLTPDTATITFDPLGRPVTLTAASLTVSGGAGTITVEAETGYVH